MQGEESRPFTVTPETHDLVEAVSTTDGHPETPTVAVGPLVEVVGTDVIHSVTFRRLTRDVCRALSLRIP